jgi:DNA-binding response OmpR family regulator
MTGQAHVLIVEDDALVADVVVEALEGSYGTSRSKTAAAALALMRGGGIDLILLDGSLPGGVDPQLIPAADAACVPVVLMSDDPELIAQVAGAERPSILKPISFAALLQVLERALVTRP